MYYGIVLVECLNPVMFVHWKGKKFTSDISEALFIQGYKRTYIKNLLKENSHWFKAKVIIKRS
jgi:hypothetical protein